MNKRLGIAFLVAISLCCVAAVFLLVGCPAEVEQMTAVPADDWSTENEVECCPGDWDTTYINAGNYITRTAAEAYSGNYSYEHYPDGASIRAQTTLLCSVPITQGVLDAHVMFSEDPGHAGADDHIFVQVGTVATAGTWHIDWDFFTKRAVFRCDMCEAFGKSYLGTIRRGVWHNYRVEWNLPPNPGTGSIQVWMDDVLWVDESGIPMSNWFGPPDFGHYWYIQQASIGPYGWNSTWSDTYEIYVDEVQIYPCDEPWPDPTPTPAPVVEDCDQYGHAAVLNVDDDCSAVLRFRAIPNYVPHDAVVTRATLFLYGVSVEQVGETINIAPLVPVWGEMTCDWCRRTVGEDWADPGATNIPLDRFPGKVAEFTAELGWVEVDIPTYIIEEWALSSAANPGLVLSNDALTGKYGIASREWVDADYRPYMVIYYTE